MESSLGELPIVAEDLGVITPAVDRLRMDHDIPGMVVLQFEVGEADFEMDLIDENSVCYTGTHDNDTTLGWFRGTGEDTRSSKEVLECRANSLKQTGGSEQTIHLDMIRLAYSSHSAISIAPMQDYLGLGSESRLNIPGTTTNNWRWRMQHGVLSPALIEWVAEQVQKASRIPNRHLNHTA